MDAQGAVDTVEASINHSCGKPSSRPLAGLGGATKKAVSRKAGNGVDKD